jgi:hypothetical protein
MTAPFMRSGNLREGFAILHKAMVGNSELIIILRFG